MDDLRLPRMKVPERAAYVGGYLDAVRELHFDVGHLIQHLM